MREHGCSEKQKFLPKPRHSSVLIWLKKRESIKRPLVGRHLRASESKPALNHSGAQAGASNRLGVFTPAFAPTAHSG